MKKYVNNSFITKSPSEYKNGTAAVTNLPVTLYTDGEPISAYTLKGNTSVSGTPSPQNPVTISGVGNETANLFDKDQTTGIISNTYINQSGQQVSAQSYYLSYPIEVIAGDVYTWSFNSLNAYHTAPTVGFYDVNDELIGVATHSAGIAHFTFTVPNNTAYLRASVYIGFQYNTNMLFKGSTTVPDGTPLEFIPYGMYEISILKDSQPLTPIYLSQPLRKSLDGTAFDTLDSTGLVTYNVDEYGQPQTATTETVTVPTITTTGGTVTLDVDTTIKPSEIDLTYHGWHTHEPLKRENGQWE